MSIFYSIKKKLIRYIPLLLLIILIFFLFGKTLFPPSGKMIYGGDIYDAYYFWKGYLSESIRGGIIPFWNPYNFSGTPFLAHPNINIFYPPNWLYILLPLNQAFAFYLFVHFLWAGITMYWLARSYTDRLGAIASSLVFVLGGYFAARVYAGHPEYIDAASWIPLVFGMSKKALDDIRINNTIKAIASIFFLILCGNELFLLFFLEIIGFYIIYLLAKNILMSSFCRNAGGQAKRYLQGDFKQNCKILTAKLFRCIFVMVVILFAGICLSAVEFFPRMQFIRLSLRSHGLPYGLASSGSLPVDGLKLFVNPYFWGKPFIGKYNYIGPWPNLFEYMYYIGFVPLFIVSGFLLFKILSKITDKVTIVTDPDIWFFLSVILLFTILSLGKNFPLNIHEILWRYIPFYKAVRFPARHLFIVYFSLSISTGIILSIIKNNIVKTVVILAVIVNLFPFAKEYFTLSDIPTSTFDKKLISKLSAGDELVRFLPDFPVTSSVRRDLDFGASSSYRIQSTSDYNSMIIWNYYRFIDLLNKANASSLPYYNVEIPPPHPESPYINFLNIKYILSDKKYDLAGKEISDKFKLVLQGDRFKLYENLRVLPRFFLVKAAKLYLSEKELEGAIFNYREDLEKSILLLKSDIKKLHFKNLDCSKDYQGSIKVLLYTPSKIVIRSRTTCNGFLSSSEVYYPGWRAKIDNVGIKVYRSNLAFRAIYLPEGEHVVEFYYSPVIYYFGGLISLFSITALFIVYKKQK